MMGDGEREREKERAREIRDRWARVRWQDKVNQKTVTTPLDN